MVNTYSLLVGQADMFQLQILPLRSLMAKVMLLSLPGFSTNHAQVIPHILVVSLACQVQPLVFFLSYLVIYLFLLLSSFAIDAQL